MNIKFTNLPIRIQLLILFLITAFFPILSSIWIISHTSEKFLRESAVNHLDALADAKAALVEDFFKDHVDNVKSFAYLNSVQQIIKIGASSDSYFDSYAKSYADRMGYSLILITDLNGKILYSSGKTIRNLKELSEDAYNTFLESKKNQKNELSELVINKLMNSSIPSCFMVTPVANPVIGYVIAQIKGQEVYDVVKHRFGLGTSGESYIFNKKNNEFVFLTPTYHDPNAVLKTFNGHSNIYNKAIAGINGNDEIIDYRLKETLVSWRFLPSLKSILLVKIDSNEAFSLEQKLNKEILFIGFITLILAAIIALIASAMFVKPIIYLKKIAQLVSQGDLDQSVSLLREDELGQLSYMFNRMIREIRVFYKQFQQKVTEKAELIIKTEKERRTAEAISSLGETFINKMKIDFKAVLESIIKLSNGALNKQSNAKENCNKITLATQQLLDTLENWTIINSADSQNIKLHEVTMNQLINEIKLISSTIIEPKTINVIIKEPLNELFIDSIKLKQAFLHIIYAIAQLTSENEIKIKIEKKFAAEGEILLFTFTEINSLINQKSLESLNINSPSDFFNLFIAKEYIELLGGKFLLINQNENTSIQVYIPI